MDKMTHASLCSGIGGFDLAAEWAGYINIFHSEIDPYCQEHLKRKFPKADSYGDIITEDYSKYNGKIHVLSGGIPCQPTSLIGRKLGDKDPRWLFPSFRRVYRQVNPVWLLLENVHGLLTTGDGQLFEEVCTQMEEDGYEVWPYVLPASGAGAGHQRNRVWVVAYSIKGRLERRDYSYSEGYRQAENRPVQALVEGRDWAAYAQSFVHRGVYGLPDRVARTAALGNAIVPQVAYTIFQSIKKYEHKIWNG